MWGRIGWRGLLFFPEVLREAELVTHPAGVVEQTLASYSDLAVEDVVSSEGLSEMIYFEPVREFSHVDYEGVPALEKVSLLK